MGLIFGNASAALAASTITVTKAETAAIFTHLNSFATSAGVGTTARANSVLTAQFATYELAMANALGKLAGKSPRVGGLKRTSGFIGLQNHSSPVVTRDPTNMKENA